ncbi:MAG: translation initiation factor [Isosphaeraceae bacterium]
MSSFAGNTLDRPPTCERCGKLEAECTCPPLPPPPPVRLDPATQTARLRVEKRAKGKMVTVVANSTRPATHPTRRSSRPRPGCGTGGTVKDGHVELQGNHLDSAEAALRGLGYKTRRG